MSVESNTYPDKYRYSYRMINGGEVHFYATNRTDADKQFLEVFQTEPVLGVNVDKVERRNS